MAETVVTWMWVIVAIYAAVGFLFAIYASWRGAGKLDPVAREGTWGFRLLIIPGLTALWPLFVKRLAQGVSEPPSENNAHRSAACSGKGEVS